ncbi:TonB-dependent receptor [Sphingomonas sp. PP-F2F-G114-C0414]|uniref:TonB-dependent receptor n=1 Tax=Sphingomonas sp. PP-F2F-G114-C0414 TaxID=2135662 RepID=UPI000EF8FB9D|nr:TonB-dependent receptor [Sphingomonas sp. PP-F2F-G114-C0414]RMB35727.1 TonB-dependent receptor [Sphingomonas sp. PP-F2F-G114-C0414]
MTHGRRNRTQGAGSSTKVWLLATSCCAALAAITPVSAQTAPPGDPTSPPAQTPPQTPPQTLAPAPATPSATSGQTDSADGAEITVTGFRQSLASAAQAKRNDIRISDGITAEDIGKFPAQNVTEAIQRIAGVQMSNINGRGSTISIRGLGAQYARTTINGQTFASADFKDGFRYDIIQTDLASAIQVVKSPTADMDTGGLSGTVNIDTVKPLAYKGPRFIVGVKGYNSEYRGKKITPKISGAYIDSFAGGTLGVMANVSYQELTDRGDYAFVKNWYNPGVVDPNNFVPGNFRLRRIDRDTKQLMASGAIQWKPQSNFEVLLQGEYSKDDTRYDTQQLVFGRWDPKDSTNPSTITVLDSANGVANKIAISNFGVGNNDQPETRNLKTQAYTGTVNWQPGDTWNVHAVAHYTRGDADLREFASIDGANVASGGTLDISDPHNVKFATDPGVWNGTLFNPANRTYFAFVDGATHIQMAKDVSGQFDVTKDIGAFGVKSLVFGVKYHHESFQTDAYRHDRDADVTRPDLYPEYAFIPNLSTTGIPVTNFLDGKIGIPNTFLETNAPLWQSILASKGITVPDVRDWANSYRVDRYIPAVYAMANLDAVLFGKPLRGNVGVRYEHTHQNVTSNVTAGTGSGSPLLGTQNVIQDYGNVLPSASFALDLSNRLVARVALAKVLVRPLLNSQTQMADTFVTDNTGIRPSVSVSNGESRLKPLTANQADISLEYYHGRGNSISIAGFYKAVKNGTFTQFYCPTSFNGVTLNGQVGGCASTDGTTDYNFSRKLNDNSVIHVKGVELAASESFDGFLPLQGFGATGNVTVVNADSPALGTGFNLRDLSKLTWNLTPYWENEMFSVRLSVNHRSPYKQDASTSFFVDGGQIHTVRARTQMDLALGFTPTKFLSFTGGIINLNDTHEDAYQTNEDTFQLASRTGRTFYLSATARF